MHGPTLTSLSLVALVFLTLLWSNIPSICICNEIIVFSMAIMRDYVLYTLSNGETLSVNTLNQLPCG